MELIQHLCERDIFKLENQRTNQSNHSLENLASKTKLTKLLKSTRLASRPRCCASDTRRDQASPPLRTGSHHHASSWRQWVAGGRVVEPAGIEPATFWLQTRRSPS